MSYQKQTGMNLKEKCHCYLIPGVVLILGIASVVMFLWSHSIKDQQIFKDYPHDDAVMEITSEISIFHLWLEEYLSGDVSIDLNKTKSHLNRARELSDGLLNGGVADEHGFPIQPVERPKMQAKAEKISSLLKKFDSVANQRINHKETMGIGTEVDQQFDNIYREIIGETAALGKLAKKDILKNQSKNEFLVNTILFSLVLIVSVSVIGLWFREKQRVAAEKKVEHLNLVLLAIRNVNQLITKEKDRDRLLQGACDNLIETRGYYHAWIALVNDIGKLQQVTQAGLSDDFVTSIRQMDEGVLPVCIQKSLNQSDIVAIKDLFSECTDCPLANVYSVREGMVLRLEYSGEIYGVLTVYTPESAVEDIDEINLFKEVTGDIAFALHSMEIEKERQKAERELLPL